MIIKGGKVFQEDGSFLEQALYINDHRLVDKAEYQDDGKVIDAEGLLVLPGLVDIHSHGAAGEDFSDGNPEGLAENPAVRKTLRNYFLLPDIDDISEKNGSARSLLQSKAHRQKRELKLSASISRGPVS